MRSMQIVDWGKPLEARDYPDPVPVGTEVILKVDACGVCHSDLHIHDGYFDLGGGEAIRIADRGMQLPFTLGHEVVGTVVALGPEAEGVQVGDRRIVFPWIGCGACAVCRRGDELLCLKPRIVGTWKDGGYSDRVRVPHARYLVAYDGIPTALAGTYACSGVTAYSAILKAGPLGPDDSLLLVGAGGVGLNGLHIAKALVPGRIVVADTDPGKREQALANGAHAVIDNAAPDALAALRQATGGGAWAAIDFVGRPSTARFAMDGLRKGGTLVVVGLYGDRMALPMPLLPLRMLTLKGSYVGTLDEMKALVALVQAGKVPPIPVETRPLAEVNGALDDLRKGRVAGRVVLQP
jgi:D-arabinose 1-dehydrogenase-like Zn-dependent alcohol dehydrogenase